MNPFLPAERKMLEELLISIFGTNAAIESLRVMTRQEDYMVMVVRLRRPNNEVVVKLAGPHTTMVCDFERTAWLHRLMKARTSLPIAEVIATDVSYKRWPWRYMVAEYITGIEWADVRPQVSAVEAGEAYKQVAVATANLHSIQFASFGDLPVGQESHSYAKFTDALKERARIRIRNKRHYDLFAQLLDGKADLFSDISSSCLCHEDLHKHNLIFGLEDKKWRLVGILDFDSAWAGHHETDLARLEMWHDFDVQAFRKTYEERHPIADSYSRRRPIYQLLWCFEYASETRKHLADTRHLCMELGIPPITSFVWQP